MKEELKNFIESVKKRRIQNRNSDIIFLGEYILELEKKLEDKENKKIEHLLERIVRSLEKIDSCVNNNGSSPVFRTYN